MSEEKQIETVKVRVSNGMIPLRDFEDVMSAIARHEPRGRNGELLPIVELVHKNLSYRIGNDQILEKMLGLYGNPKGCCTGEAPK